MLDNRRRQSPLLELCVPIVAMYMRGLLLRTLTLFRIEASLLTPIRHISIYEIRIAKFNT